MSIRPTQPQSVGGVLDTTFQLCKVSVRKLVPLSLLMAIASSPASLYVFAQGGVDPSDLWGVLHLIVTPGYLLANVASCIGVVFIAAAASMKMAAIAGDGDLSTATALQKALLHLPYLVVSLILYIAIVAIGPVLLIAPVLMSRPSTLAVVLGLPLTIAALVLGVSLLLFVGTQVFENLGPVRSLTASYRLVRGNWWRTNAILAAGTVVLLVIYTVPVLLVGAVTLLGGGTGSVATTGLVGDLAIDFLASPLMTPFGVALFLAVYWDLQLRKAGRDL